MRARGLKLNRRSGSDRGKTSRPVRARGLKLESHSVSFGLIRSHSVSFGLIRSRPVRARGLKPLIESIENCPDLSRPVRARGLKQLTVFFMS